MSSYQNFRTRLAAYCDFEIVLHLEKCLFGEKERFSSRRLHYLMSSQNTTFRLCYSERTCVGYSITLINRLRNGKLKGRIYAIGILSSYRHQGGGSKLLKVAEKDLFHSKVSFITLETKKGSTGAIGFFLGHGYTTIEQLPEYYLAGHGVRMRKEIS